MSEDRTVIPSGPFPPRTITPTLQPESAAQAAIDLRRWRTAVELAEKLRKAGCAVAVVPAKRRH